MKIEKIYDIFSKYEENEVKFSEAMRVILHAIVDDRELTKDEKEVFRDIINECEILENALQKLQDDKNYEKLESKCEKLKSINEEAVRKLEENQRKLNELEANLKIYENNLKNYVSYLNQIGVKIPDYILEDLNLIKKYLN